MEKLKTVEEFCADNPYFKGFVDGFFHQIQNTVYADNTCRENPMSKAFYQFRGLTLVSEDIFRESLESNDRILNGEYKTVRVEIQPNSQDAID